MAAMDCLTNFSVIFALIICGCGAQPMYKPRFIKDMNDLEIREDRPPSATIPVYTLVAFAEMAEGINATIQYEMVSDIFYLVNPNFDGQVYQKKTLDFELKQDRELKVQITATNYQNPTYSTSYTSNPKLFDVNDEKPKFQYDNYQTTVPENEPPGKTVFTIQVTDVDTVNRILDVYCDPTDLLPEYKKDCDLFEVKLLSRDNSQWNGVIILRGSLDFEASSIHRIGLTCFDGLNNETMTAEISVLNVQDTPPIWTRVETITKIETVPANTVLDYVQAKDGDNTDQRPIRYSMPPLKNDPTLLTYFAIDSVSGNITNLVALDREDPVFNLGYVEMVLLAQELDTATNTLGNSPINSTETSIRIELTDANDWTPLFDKSVYTVFMKENLADNTTLDLIYTITDKDIGDFAYFRYSLINYNDRFKVSANDESYQRTTGRLIVENSSLLDYEKGPKTYTLELRAIETRTSPPRTGTAQVIVNLQDVNDNIPDFVPPVINATISETVPSGFLVTTLRVVDEDSGSQGVAGVVFEFSGDSSDLFILNRTTGEFRVAPCATPGVYQCIDYDHTKQYVFTVSAQDDNGFGRKKTTTLTVNILDSNDNRPVFQSLDYVSYIREEESIPNPPLRVLATDVDTVGGPVRYSILNDTTGLWLIDPSTGEITARRPILWSDTINDRGYFEFHVEASDAITSGARVLSKVTINVIDINNYAPELVGNTVRIAEDTPGNSFVYTVTAVDRDTKTSDNGIVDYFIDSGAEGKFTLNRTSGEIRTMSDAKFDASIKDIYYLKIIARDRGTPPKDATATVTVEITDSNNKDPFFDPKVQRAEVYENVNVGYSVYKMSASDPDIGAQLKYYFREPKSARGPIGNLVDRANYDYSQLFVIEEDTGIVKTNAPLDRDMAAIINITVEVQDVAASPVQTNLGTILIVVLEFNDEPPRFINVKNYTLEEERPFGTVFMVLQAIDADDDISRYEISNDPFDLFDVNFQSGSVNVRNRIDFETLESAWFEATAYDDGTPQQLSATTTIWVQFENINDISPKFSKNVYDRSLPEHSPPGTSVVQVFASDGDKGDYGVVRYSMQDPRFTIDPINGLITVAPGADLDREKQGEIDVQVTAEDSPNDATVRRSTTISVFITLEDINDNPPVFNNTQYNAQILETIPITSSVLRVMATDLDLGLFGSISYFKLNSTSDPDNLFSINSKTGIIEVAKSLLKKVDVYTFAVEAIDENGSGPHSAVARVTIQVLEATNSKPDWVIPPITNMTIYVLENQYLGMVVYHVHAKDEDSGDNGLVDYGLYYQGVLTQSTPEFMINKITGVIRAEREFDREEQDRYTLLLSAKDNAKQPQETTRFLTVTILDVNDNDPVFTLNTDGTVSPYEVQVGEDAAVGTSVTKVLATDADSEQYNRIYYYIISGNDKGYFRMDADTGELFLASKLDREEQSTFYLDVQATNNVSDYRVITERRRRAIDPSIATIIVRVGNTNDQAPSFINKPYHGCISTKASVGQSIVQVQAEDKDSQGSLFYSIIGGNTNSRFRISAASGIISNSVLLNQANTYVLSVQANDSKLIDSADVRIFVTEPATSVTMVIQQPAYEVRTFAHLIQKWLESVVDSNNKHYFDYVCLSSVNDHITTSGSKSTLWSEITVTAICQNCDGNNYNVYTGEELQNKLEELKKSDPEGFDLYYINSFAVTSDEDKEVDNVPAMIVLIIIIVLFVCAILFILIACYCIKRRPRTEERDMIIESSNYDNGVPSKNLNPVYDNRGFVVDTSYDPDIPYASVHKPSRPKYPEPDPEPVLIIPPEQEDEQDDGVVPQFYPDTTPPRSRTSSDADDTRIETEIVDDKEGEPVDTYRIETSVM